MIHRLLAVCAAAVLAGSLFAPVFGLGALLPVIAAAALPAAAVLCRLRGLEAWRAVLAVAAGLAGLLAAVRPADPVAALVGGAANGWRLALQSTWPVRPDPEPLVFVPLLVLAAVVFGAELLLRLRAPLVALLPALAVLGLSQAYAAATGATAVLAALAFAACGAVLVARAVPWAAVALGAAGATALGAVSTGAPASLRDGQFAPPPATRVANPLGDLAARLADPDLPVFEYTSDEPVDRWSIAVLDDFDGVNWTPGGELRRLGVGLPPGAAAPARRRSATVRPHGLTGPWLPSQARPAEVTGVDPLVYPARGTLLAERRPAEYELAWWEPETDAAALAGAAIDPAAEGGFGGVGEVPAEVVALANDAVRGMRSSFQTALALERHLREEYRLVVDGTPPVGHGWPQLTRFLVHDKRGTSEQFAAAYVALARVLGIPARLVVGFAAPGSGSVVRNGDALAWPEVAVAGVGWVALDPTGRTRGTAATSLSQATEEARGQLPPGRAPEPVLPPGTGDGEHREPFPWTVAPWAVAALAAGWLLAVPALVTARSWRRRRAGTVAAAWVEVRDRLRAHGVPVTPAMTVRDLASAAAPVAGGATADAVRGLADAVDAALWSGAPVDARQRAWAAVGAVRSALARRPFRDRLRAVYRG
ncbi:transglutaminase domain-containing protein [Saccharothrix xinjiangensis]|uniref:Transglutaminase domain-containing protein n=1 Tax=Saccharothrix xinjiangensis TaxID=204798 RepID=A0ABV9YAF9_9PSEU